MLNNKHNIFFAFCKKNWTFSFLPRNWFLTFVFENCEAFTMKFSLYISRPLWTIVVVQSILRSKQGHFFFHLLSFRSFGRNNFISIAKLDFVMNSKPKLDTFSKAVHSGEKIRKLSSNFELRKPMTCISIDWNSDDFFTSNK